jgi:hypothetical protein
VNNEVFARLCAILDDYVRVQKDRVFGSTTDTPLSDLVLEAKVTEKVVFGLKSRLQSLYHIQPSQQEN